MIVVLDESIPFWQESFARVGEVRPFSGRTVPPKALLDADALIVRTVTRVDASALKGSSVRFVGTVSVGTDHLDLEFLRSRRVYVANCAGSNANAVSEYVIAALMVISERRGWNIQNRSLGIVGVGNVGSLVEIKARALGMEVLLCDPPLRDTTGDPCYRSYQEVLNADFVTFHVPLTTSGRYPTWHMLDRTVLDDLAPGQILLNTSRGSVFNSEDLKVALQNDQTLGAVLDVWEGEPVIDYSLLQHVEIGTNHIAGSSLDAKVRGTEVIFDELCRFFSLSKSWNGRKHLPRPSCLHPDQGMHGVDVLRSIVLLAYDIQKDDASLRSLADLTSADAAAAFDQRRDNYRLRQEFRHFVVKLPEDELNLEQTILALGFKTSTQQSHGSEHGDS